MNIENREEKIVDINGWLFVLQEYKEDDGTAMSLALDLGRYIFNHDWVSVARCRAQIPALRSKEKTWRNGCLLGIELVALGALLSREQELPWRPSEDGKTRFVSCLEAGDEKALEEAAIFGGAMCATGKRKQCVFVCVATAARAMNKRRNGNTRTDFEAGIMMSIESAARYMAQTIGDINVIEDRTGESDQLSSWLFAIGRAGGTISEEEMVELVDKTSDGELTKLAAEQTIVDYTFTYLTHNEEGKLVREGRRVKTPTEALRAIWALHPPANVIRVALGIIQRRKEEGPTYELTSTGWTIYEQMTRSEEIASLLE